MTAACERHKSAIHTAALRVLGDHAAAEDVCQDVFLALWINPGRVDLSRGTMRAYLVTMARRRAIDAVRQESARHDREDKVASADRAADQFGDLVAELVTTADVTRRRADQLRRAVVELPHKQREAVELAYFDRQTYRGVAGSLAIPEGTAKSRLRAALATIARRLPPDDTLQTTSLAS
jgi:RNA polymerase sigma-70 factor (ECF subfamily)